MCPEGLNGQMEASQFTFKELPLWDAATPSKPTCELQMMAVDLSNMQAEGATTTTQDSQPHTNPTPSLANTA